MPEKVQCKTCGFLTLRHFKTSEMIEAIPLWREQGAYGGHDLHTRPAQWVCYLNSPAFPPRPPKGASHETDETCSAREIQTPINCDEWRAYRPGKNPKEHEDMTILEQVRSEQSQSRVEDMRWQKQVEALAETRHQELRGDGKKTIFWSAVAALVAAIIGGLLSRQW